MNRDQQQGMMQQGGDQSPDPMQVAAAASFSTTSHQPAYVEPPMAGAQLLCNPRPAAGQGVGDQYSMVQQHNSLPTQQHFGQMSPRRFGGDEIPLSLSNRSNLGSIPASWSVAQHNNSSPRRSPPRMQPPASLQSSAATECSPKDHDLSVLRLTTQTWNRDSHELFDYESQHLYSKNYLLNRAIRVFRRESEIFCLEDGFPLPTAGEYLVSVRPRDNKWWIFPADRTTCVEAPGTLTARKLFLITKYLKDKQYALTEGDIIKLGRFKVRVKQIALATDPSFSVPPPPVDYRVDDGDHPVTELSPLEASTTQCRICLLEGAEEADPLIQVCQCKGSIMYVHLECLRHWVNGRINLAQDDGARSCYFIRQIPCELCKAAFPAFVTFKNSGVRMSVVNVPKVDPPFIVLENMVGPGNKGVHLCSLSSKQECKLGRGHESDVRIADVSISRWHATIKYIGNEFRLEDQDSKFGTLVALRKSVSVEMPPDELYLQVGRTVLKFGISDSSENDKNMLGEKGIVEISPPLGRMPSATDHLTPSVPPAGQQQNQQQPPATQQPEPAPTTLEGSPQRGSYSANSPLAVDPFGRYPADNQQRQPRPYIFAPGIGPNPGGGLVPPCLDNTGHSSGILQPQYVAYDSLEEMDGTRPWMVAPAFSMIIDVPNQHHPWPADVPPPPVLSQVLYETTTEGNMSPAREMGEDARAYPFAFPRGPAGRYDDT